MVFPGVMSRALVVPPSPIETPRLVLRRAQLTDAELIAEAVRESLDHLRPWMPWAEEPAGTVDAQRERLSELERDKGEAHEVDYLALTRDEQILVGCCGLHRRIGPAAIEIGYWIHVSHTNRGYGLEVAGALTGAAWSLPDIERVEIRCDLANRASLAIPRRLGYVLDRVEGDEITTPGESGHSMIWVLRRPDATRLRFVAP
jgi:RimJ/RimL family protein N-acetyltransferase